jgi:F-type H+-transporting ATPase subunit a
LINALSLLTQAAYAEASDGGFSAPSIDEFYPEIIAFQGTWFELDRIMLIRLLVMTALIVLFWLWSSKFKKAHKNNILVPSRFQLMGEISLNFVRKNIAHEQLGEKDGERFLPLLTTMFFLILGMNITGILPFLNIAGTSRIGLPIVLAAVAYVTFIYAGVRRHRFKFFTANLFPAGVPKPFYVLVTPIEFLSTFILRPVTLALRLTMNMIAGHLLLVLCFSATQFFFFNADGFFKLFGAGTFVFGFAFTVFEILVSFLQAYVFTLLTTVYIQLALADEH